MTQHSIYIIAAVAAGVVCAAEAAPNAGTAGTAGTDRAGHKPQDLSSRSNNDRHGGQSFDYLGGVVNQRPACSLG